ncbi:hypothetical protein H2203_003841 [Taxawa tesnikishii (nom. ined.)]|nr:hypothetical protein H2203_003841 [Dothideales sp. JES 119]
MDSISIELADLPGPRTRTQRWGRRPPRQWIDPNAIPDDEQIAEDRGLEELERLRVLFSMPPTLREFFQEAEHAMRAHEGSFNTFRNRVNASKLQVTAEIAVYHYVEWVDEVRSGRDQARMWERAMEERAHSERRRSRRRRSRTPPRSITAPARNVPAATTGPLDRDASPPHGSPASPVPSLPAQSETTLSAPLSESPSNTPPVRRPRRSLREDEDVPWSGGEMRWSGGEIRLSRNILPISITDLRIMVWEAWMAEEMLAEYVVERAEVLRELGVEPENP